MGLSLAHTQMSSLCIFYFMHYIVSSLRTISNAQIHIYIYAFYSLLGLSLAHIPLVHC